MSESDRYTGKVKWFSPEKCYGFIELPERDGVKEPDVFVHFRGIRGSGWRNLSEGQLVDFEIVKGEKGKQANDVVVVGEGNDETLEGTT